MIRKKLLIITFIITIILFDILSLYCNVYAITNISGAIAMKTDDKNVMVGQEFTVDVYIAGNTSSPYMVKTANVNFNYNTEDFQYVRAYKYNYNDYGTVSFTPDIQNGKFTYTFTSSGTKALGSTSTLFSVVLKAKSSGKKSTNLTYTATSNDTSIKYSDTDAKLTMNVIDNPYIGYNANEWDLFKNRTKEEIGHKYTTAYYTGETYKNGKSDTYYTRIPSLKEPYDGGYLTEDTLKAVEAQINYYRYLVGVQPLKNSITTSEQMQVGALARNFYFSHGLSGYEKPEGMTDEMWNMAKNCPHNVLAQGYSPAKAINGWINEGYNKAKQKFDTIGHRLAVIDQTTSDFDYGYSGNVAIGGIKCSNPQKLPFSAFPAPGYMPLNDISSNGASWTLDINTTTIQKPTNSSDLKVKVTNLNNGTSYECTTTNNKLQVFTSLGYDLSFEQPDIVGYKYADGDKFKVEVTGFTEKSTGNEITLTYTVEFFDVTNYVDNSIITSFSTSNGLKKINISEENQKDEVLQSLSKLLPKTITINTELGRKAIIELKNNWILDTNNKCWTNTVNNSDIPSFAKDTDNLLKNIKITYGTDKNNYLSYSKLTLDSKAKMGKTGKMKMQNLYLSVGGDKKCEIYKIDENGQPQLKYTNKIDSEKYNCEFDIDSYTLEDSGTYFSIYYNDEGSNLGYYGINVAGVGELNVTEYLKGDVNGDDKVSLIDYGLVLAHVKKTKSLEGEELKTADVKGDGKVTLIDYGLILAHVKGTKLLE